jgi:hypothetical protein
LRIGSEAAIALASASEAALEVDLEIEVFLDQRHHVPSLRSIW